MENHVEIEPQSFTAFNTKKTGEGVKLPPPLPPYPPRPYGFFKTVFSREGLKPRFFVTVNIIVREVFPETFIEFLKSLGRYEDFYRQC